MINFHNADISFQLRNRKLLKTNLQVLFSMEQKEIQNVDYIFCSDPFLLELNRNYLKHDYLTDILTFDLSISTAIIADIYISIERVKENSNILKCSFSTELHRVIIHGALHLCGFADSTLEEITKMRDKEEEYLRLFAS